MTCTLSLKKIRRRFHWETKERNQLVIYERGLFLFLMLCINFGCLQATTNQAPAFGTLVMSCHSLISLRPLGTTWTGSIWPYRLPCYCWWPLTISIPIESLITKSKVHRNYPSVTTTHSYFGIAIYQNAISYTYLDFLFYCVCVLLPFLRSSSHFDL